MTPMPSQQPDGVGVAKARATVKLCLETANNSGTHLNELDTPEDGMACSSCISHLVRTVEAETWEKAAKFVDANRCRDSFRMSISCGHVPCDYSKAVAQEFRLRASGQARA